MPFVGYGIYAFLRKHGHEKIGVILGSYLGLNAATLLAGVELGLQAVIATNVSGQPLYNPYPITIAVPAMLFAHLLVAGVVEAFFTYAVYAFVKKVTPAELYTPTHLISFYPHLLRGYFYFYQCGFYLCRTLWPKWCLAQRSIY